MINGANDEMLTIKMELKAHDRSLYMFDKKVDLLEQAYQHHSEKLDDIETKISAVDINLREIRDLLSRQKGSSETKDKITTNVYMFATMIATLIAALSELAWKAFGK